MKNDEHLPIRELLPEYLRGELGPSRNELVSEHLAACPQCEAEARILESYAALDEPDPGPAFWARLPEAIAERSRRPAQGPGPMEGRALGAWWGRVPFQVRALAGAASLAALVLMLAIPVMRMAIRPQADWSLPQGPAIATGIEADLLGRSGSAALIEDLLEIDLELTGDELEALLPGSDRRGLDALMLDPVDLEVLETVLDRMGERS